MLIVLLAAVCGIIALAFLLWIWRLSPFHVAASFILFALVDVFFPAIYWTWFGQVGNPGWLRSLSSGEVLSAVAYYSVFFFIFIFCIIAGDGQLGRSNRKSQKLIAGVEWRLQKTIWVFLILASFQMGDEIMRYGGWDPWFWSRLALVAVTDSNGVNDQGKNILSSLPISGVFQALVGLGFYFRLRVKQSHLFTYIFPSIALFFALTTFLRGAVLTCVITLIFAEYIRKQSESGIPSIARHKKKGPVLMLAFAGLLSIYLYGAVRDNFRGLLNSTDDSATEIALPTFVTAGHGLRGVAHIVAGYGDNIQFLGGKTYFDMLLLPVPRVIYKSKPEWYGIDEITRGMGWPESTQSAVTLPGEAYANFGLYGLFVAIPLGLIFGLLQKNIRSTMYRHVLLGPTVFFQMASVTNWMSFTGVMNAVPLLLALFVIAGYLSSGGMRMIRHRPCAVI